MPRDNPLKSEQFQALICSSVATRAKLMGFVESLGTHIKAILNFLYEEVTAFPREFEEMNLRWDILRYRELIICYETPIGKILTLSKKGYRYLGLGTRVVSPDACVEYMYKRAFKNDLEGKFFVFLHFQGKNVMVFKKDGFFYYATGSYRGLRSSNIRKIHSRMKPFLISPSQLLVFHPRPYQVSHLVQDLKRLEILTLAV